VAHLWLREAQLMQLLLALSALVEVALVQVIFLKRFLTMSKLINLVFITSTLKFMVQIFLSFSLTISDYYGVYTDVYTFLPWINSVLSVSIFSVFNEVQI
jgi:hypothetical protein